MNTNVIVALIAFVGTAIGSLGGIIASARLTAFRLKKLEEKVDAHNGLIERVAVVEQRVAAVEKKVA